MIESSRPQTIVFLGLSLDGCIAGEDGDLSWLAQCAGESTAETGYDDLMRRADTLLIGRRTYESVLGFPDWPWSGKRVRVLTRRPMQARFDETPCSGSIESVLADLGAAGSRVSYLDGGDVVRQALRAGVVDELTLSWIPVVLGNGTRLFESGLPGSNWQLIHTRGFASGMVQATYRRRTGPAGTACAAGAQ